MMRILLIYLLSSFFALLLAQAPVRWCTVSSAEQTKCQNLIAAINNVPALKSAYLLQCTPTNEVFDCMAKIKNNETDLATFDIGQGHYGMLLYSLRPIAVENYASSNVDGQSNLYYYSNIVVPKGIGMKPTDFKMKDVCFGGVGSAEGWTMPLSKLVGDMQAIKVTECNSLVQSLNKFLKNYCAPGALSETFNPFGDNTFEACAACYDKDDTPRYCNYQNAYAGSTGALRCLTQRFNPDSTIKPVAAFVRSQAIDLLINDGSLNANDYELLCPQQQADGGFTANLSSWQTCQWGRIKSRMVMTSMTRPDIQFYQRFISALLATFGPGGTNPDLFNLFSSANYTDYLGNQVHDLMFSDYTQNLYIPPESQISTYYVWVDQDFKDAQTGIAYCPMVDVRWCVVHGFEMEKCERMKSALDAKGIRPEFNCIQGGTTVNCMNLIQQGYADLMTLDAGDLYVGGKKFGLVPIASEFYGDTSYYYAVAIAKKTNKEILISNMKYRRTCHNGVGKATGWVIPLNIFLETSQIRVYGKHLMHAFSELVSRACVPGVLNSEYNPTNFNALNLCEICSGGNDDKCQRDSRELYYGDTGAFRCLVESGDVAFARHTTVHDNTGGRNLAWWARIRRMDDFELLCPDGSRVQTDKWRQCNLGKIPGNTVVTANFKDANQRMELWRLLRYSQEYYASDVDQIFSIFDSGFSQSDLMFTDNTVSLKPISPESQTYTDWLGSTFIRQIENLEFKAGNGESGIYSHGVPGPRSISCLLMSALMLAAVGLLLW